MNFQKSGIAIIGLPGSGKSGLGRGLKFDGYRFNDMDNDGLENPTIGYGKGGVAQLVQSIGDRAFLRIEADFVMKHYGLMSEGKAFSLNNMIFSTSGSIVKVAESIQYLRNRMHTILIKSSNDDTEEINTVLKNICNRADGATRIVGINGGPHGEEPESKTLDEELRKRLELYHQYADHTFVHPYTKIKADRVNALKDFIYTHNLATPTAHSA